MLCKINIPCKEDRRAFLNLARRLKVDTSQKCWNSESSPLQHFEGSYKAALLVKLTIICQSVPEILLTDGVRSLWKGWSFYCFLTLTLGISNFCCDWPIWIIFVRSCGDIMDDKRKKFCCRSSCDSRHKADNDPETIRSEGPIIIIFLFWWFRARLATGFFA